MSMYHNNYNHNKSNNDTNSFGSSVDTPDPEIPEDMTEEKAMEIWLRKDDEIRARMIREEEMAAERASAEPNQEAVLDEQLYYQQQQPNNIAAAAQHHQSTNSEYEMSYDSDSCGDSNLPLAIPAAQSNSAAWQDAISHNPIDPNDPAQHETWLAYERFIQLNKPGVADNYVPSTPGLARLIEEQREEERRALVRRTEQQQARAAAEVQQQERRTSSPSSTSLRREEYVNQQILRMQQQHQCQWDNNNNFASAGFNMNAYGAQHQQQIMSAHQMGASSMSTSQGLYTSHAAQGTQARSGGLPPLVDMNDDVYRRYHQEQQTVPPAINPQDPLILAQARELERLSQEHRAAQSLNDSRGNTTTAYPPPSRNINSIDVVGTPSTPPIDDLKPAAKKGSDSSSASSEAFYLATPQSTQYNTQPVICSHCQAPLHTHPLALNYFCQHCCRVTRKDEGGAEYQQGQVGQKSEWGESKYEEKMMEGEDYLDQDDMMGIGSWGSSR